MSAPTLPSTDTAIQQVINGDRNQIIGQVSGGTIIYVSGNYVNGGINGSDANGSAAASDQHLPQPKRRPQPIQLAPKSFPLLLGRQVEVKLATDTLPYHQPLEFYGASGIGKTVLLRYLAHHPAIAPAFPAGLIYLRHRCYQSASDLLQVLYEAFYETPTPTKPTDVVIRQALAGCQALVLLDEAALPAVELEQLINELPDLTFVFAAKAHQLMGDGKAVALDGLATEDAIALIVRELGQPLSEIERQAALAIAAALNGHPRQILQAIALTRETGTSLAEVAKQLQKPGHLLATLNNTQRRVLALLAVLAGSALAAERIADVVGVPAVQPILDLLQRRHLIERAEAGYRVLDKVALSAEEFALWRDRSIEYFTQWLQQQGGMLETMEEAEALFRCLEWSVEASQWHDAAILGQALEKAFSLSGQWDAWEQSLQWLLQSAQASGNQALEGYALHQLGTRALCLNQLTVAQAYLEQARDIRTALNDPALEATLQNLSFLHAPPLPPPAPPAPPARSLPTRGKALLWGGVAAVVALLGYVTWNVARPISSEPATVGLTGLVNVLSDLPPIVLPDNESCTNYRVTSVNGEAAIAQISSISINQPQSVSQAAGQIQVRPGETISGTVQLNCEAPSTGLSLDMTLRKDTASQSLEKVAVQSGQKQGSFQIQVPADYPAGQATLIASHPDLQEATRTLNIIRSNPPTPDPQPPDPTCPDSDTALDLTLNASEAEPGETLSGTVSLNCTPQGRVLIRLSSSQPNFAVPESVVIPAGTQTASFNIRVPTSYPGQEPVTITAIANDTLRDAEQLTVQIPQDPQQAECDRKRALYEQGAISGNQLIQLAVQNEVNWGSTVTVQIALECPSPSGVSSVQLASDGDDDYLVQNLPSAIAVESGTSTFSFNVPADGDNYPKGKQVTITATYDGYSATLPIDIPPFSDPPVSDNPSFSANPATDNTNSQSQQVQFD